MTPVHGRRRGLADLPASLEHRLGSGRVPRTGSTSAVDARSPTVRLNPSGCVNLILLCHSGSVGGCRGWEGSGCTTHANQPIEVSAGPWVLHETDRVYSGQQRVDRIAFSAGGTRLAATCPRYERVVIYQVDSPDQLKEIKVVDLEGRPVAITANGDRFLVLVRPSGDNKHIEPGWWETFDLEGNRVGQRTPTGYYPDDFAVSPDRKYLVVIDSGQCGGRCEKAVTRTRSHRHGLPDKLTSRRGPSHIR